MRLGRPAESRAVARDVAAGRGPAAAASDRPRLAASRSGLAWSGWAASGYGRGLVALLAIYLTLYGGLLVWTDGLPYVSDNNESFSVLWHAQNMANQDFFRSYWLTDEAFSPHPAAHPFVHTHQGNVPRLFGFLLYVLGARTIEAQIVITTLTLGTLCVFLMYHFFTRIAGPLFALVTALVFLTDYLFYAQWHIVTYRVWHGIFLFGGLTCAYGVIRAARPRRWLLLTWLTFAGLFYYELVFVAFVSMLCALYAVAIGWRRPRRVVLFGSMQVLGGLTALGVLTLQLIGYLGWDGLKQDIYLTFVSRNFADPAIQAQVEAFYTAHNVAFWKNVLDSTPYRNPRALLGLLFGFHLQGWTPLLEAIVLVVVGGWLLGLAGWPTALLAFARRFGADPLAGWLPSAAGWEAGRWSLRGLLRVRIGSATARAYLSFDADLDRLVRPVAWWLPRAVPLTLAGQFALVRITADRAFLGMPSSAPPAVSFRVSVLLFLVALVVTVGGLLLFRRAGDGPETGRPEPGRVALATALLLAVGLLVPLQPMSYQMNNFAAIWNGAIQSHWPVLVMRGAFVAALVVGAALALGGSRRLLGGAPAASLADVARFLCCGAIALAVVYVLATGYVISGYVWRYAPLWVFVLDVVLGACATVVLVLAARATARLGGSIRQLVPRVDASPAMMVHRLGQSLWREPQLAATLVGAAAAAGIAVLLCAFTIVYWLDVQRTYVALLPPTHFRVLKLLREPPYQGASFVVDMFAGPVAAQTGQWAYFDPQFGAGVVRETPAGFVVERDMNSYLWLADRRENPAYARPEYFVCLSLQTIQSVVAQLTQREGVYNTRCSDRGIVRQIDAGEFTPLARQVVARDDVSDSWVIVRLGWEYAPYLVPFEDGSRVRLTVEPPQAARGVSIEYRYAHQDGLPEQDAIVRLHQIQSDGQVTLLGSLNGPGRIELPDRFSGRIWASVTPRTEGRLGREYVSDEVMVTGSGR